MRLILGWHRGDRAHHVCALMRIHVAHEQGAPCVVHYGIRSLCGLVLDDLMDPEERYVNEPGPNDQPCATCSRIMESIERKAVVEHLTRSEKKTPTR